MGKTVMELKAEIDACGRPRADFATVSGMFASLKAAQAWDKLNPGIALHRAELCVELEHAEQVAEAIERERVANERFLSRFALSGVNERDAVAAEALQETPVLAFVRRWFNSKPRQTWCVLSGGFGVGKTVASVWALRQAARGGFGVAFRSAGEVARLSMFDAGAADLAFLKSVGFLVLDDFGSEHVTKYGDGLLGDLTNSRHGNFKPTILTTNLTGAEIKKMAGHRLVDRWTQDGAFFAGGGASLRKSKTKEGQKVEP